jgi:hypothetical protein
MGIKDAGGRWQRYLMKRGAKATDGVGGWSSQRPSHVEGGGTLYETRYETVSMRISHQRVKDWTLWRGRPPPKRTKTY